VIKRVMLALASTVALSTLAMTLTIAAEPTEVRAVAADAQAQTFSFALIGDGPYSDAKEVAFDRMINDINLDKAVEFVIHVGDIKSGREACTDARLTRRFEQLQKIRTALVYTPGDNEWTDCHRENNGSWNPVERLSFIRKLFFPNPSQTTGQTPFDVETQANNPAYTTFVENTFFTKGHVAFSTIHVVGSHNGLMPWKGLDASDSRKEPRPDRIEEYKARQVAALDWLDVTFDRAKTNHAAAVVVTVHAEMQLDLKTKSYERRGFEDFLVKLSDLSNAFKGPVLLVHGDSHVYRVDQPGLAADLAVPNLTRIEVFGDSGAHWVKATFNPGDENQQPTFSFEPRQVDTPVGII